MGGCTSTPEARGAAHATYNALHMHARRVLVPSCCPMPRTREGARQKEAVSGAFLQQWGCGRGEKGAGYLPPLYYP